MIRLFVKLMLIHIFLIVLFINNFLSILLEFKIQNLLILIYKFIYLHNKVLFK